MNPHIVNRMSAEERERLQFRRAAERQEMERLYDLPDHELGQELLRLGREIRAAVPGLGSPLSIGSGYTAFILWHVVPEMARRLGAKLGPNEATNPEVKINSPERLRVMVSRVLQWADVRYLAAARQPYGDLCPVRVLFHEIENGSPIIMALDRVAPPEPDYMDYAARNAREVSCQRGHEEVSAWNPGLQYEPSMTRDVDEEPTPFYWG